MSHPIAVSACPPESQRETRHCSGLACAGQAQVLHRQRIMGKYAILSILTRMLNVAGSAHDPPEFLSDGRRAMIPSWSRFTMIALIAWITATPASADKRDNSIRFAYEQVVENIDPFFNSVRGGFIIGQHVWD